jgi:hypothetical protein
MTSTSEVAIDTNQSLTDQSNQLKRKGGRKPVESYPHLDIISCFVDIHLAICHTGRMQTT